MTKNLEKYYMNRPLDDLTALKAKATTGLVDGLFVNVLSMTPYGGKFTWVSTSTQTPDNINVILPDDSTGDGRWIRDTFIGFSVDNNGNIALPGSKYYTIQNSADFTASFHDHIDADYSIGGNLTATSVGGAAIAGSYLDLAHDDVRYIYFYPTNFVPLKNLGTIRFKIQFGYAGSPADWVPIFCVAEQMTSAMNQLSLIHQTDGHMQLYVLDGTATLVIDGNFGSFSPVLGTLYEFALVIDFDTGASALYVDGTQQGSTITTPVSTRTNAIGVICIGTLSTPTTHNSNFLIKDLEIYPSVLYTTTYTPGYEVPSASIFMGFQSSNLHNLNVGGNLGRSVSRDITAFATGGQTNATKVYGDYNIVTICATSGDSVMLMPMAGDTVHTKTVKNNGAASCDIFPIVGGYMDGVLNTAYALASGSSKTFLQSSPNHWVSL